MVKENFAQPSKSLKNITNIIAETSRKETKISNKFMTYFSTSFKMKKSLMLTDPVLSETHSQSTGFVEDDIDAETKNENIKFTELVFYTRLFTTFFMPGKGKLVCV